ncbi:hypothetical protein SKAU_G00238970 [Synaphobranchus kaupii]|uniref:C2H2-type domain-containing protein n=1 Tax=Synaphobranchus kaupii TaxID=118154 RepID=A0A9Q1IU45_SYNKA|nr:hypothetical protein SKAU_G00238970 [Synaphobranchus kaupii]
MNATLPSIEECKLSSMSCPPSESMMDSTKLTNTNSLTESVTDCQKCSSPTSSAEDIKAESLMDSSGVEPRSSLNRFEDIEESTERKTGYLMSREQKDKLTNMKEEEEDGERQSVKIEGKDGVRDEEGLWKKEEKESDEEMEGHVTDHVAQTGKKEVEELSTLVKSCLQKQPRVLIRRLEVANSSVPVLLPPRTLTYKRDLGARSPWKQHELLSLRGNGSLRQKKGQVMIRKRKTSGQLERPLKMLPSSSENRICAEASLISPVIYPRNQHPGQTGQVSSQVFGCSQCPFVHTEEVNLHQHIKKVHPEELNRTMRSQQRPSSTHQQPTPPKTLPTTTQSRTGEHPYACSQHGKTFTQLSTLDLDSPSHTG